MLLVILLLDPPVYQSSTSLQDVKLVGALVAEGQAHLFADWPAPGEQDDDKRRLLAQLRHLDKSYAGGLGLQCGWEAGWPGSQEPGGLQPGQELRGSRGDKAVGDDKAAA